MTPVSRSWDPSRHSPPKRPHVAGLTIGSAALRDHEEKIKIIEEKHSAGMQQTEDKGLKLLKPSEVDGAKQMRTPLKFPMEWPEVRKWAL